MLTHSAPSSISMDCRPQQNEPLTVRRLADVNPEVPDAKWLVEDLWLNNGVGLLGGQAKVCKTFLAAELALAVASGRPALGRFDTHRPGPVLFFGAEDSPQALRSRFEGLATVRGCDINSLPVHLIDAPRLRLDRHQDLQRLCLAIQSCKPRLLVLDPYVRMVDNIDENSAAAVSAVLGRLRAIQRDYQLAIILVHHARKAHTSNPYQAYRGSSDFAAWADCNLLMTRKNKLLTLTVQHRSARSPDPLTLKFEQHPAPHLLCGTEQTETTICTTLTPVAELIRHQLQTAARPMTTGELRERLRRRKSDIVAAIELLRERSLLHRTNNGWLLSSPGPTADNDTLT